MREIAIERLPMTAVPNAQGPGPDPFQPKPDPRRPFNPSRRFTQLMPLMLPSLLARQAKNTRFAAHMGKRVPACESRVSLLLSVCGYHVRLGAALRMRGASARWMPVQMPLPKESMLEFLRRTCDRDWPASCMDANDERLDVVFARL